MRDIYKERRITQALGGFAVTAMDWIDELDTVRLRTPQVFDGKVTPNDLAAIRNACKQAQDKTQSLERILDGLKHDMTPTQELYGKRLACFVRGVNEAFFAHLDFTLAVCERQSDKTSALFLKQVEARRRCSSLVEAYLRIGDELTALIDEMAAELNQ
ncbi:MAG: hypothetical protein IT195_13670 [Microthrixaceae bacterium]|nr:hypothetical protein [Microthrixaceae bacterium]